MERHVLTVDEEEEDAFLDRVVGVRNMARHLERQLGVFLGYL